MKFNDYWKPPRKTKEFFSPKYEKQLKEKYGALYTLHTVLSIIILLAPFFVFLYLSPSNAFDAKTESGNLIGAVGGIIGLIGSFSIGVGFVNVFMVFIKQYLGHLVTLIAILGGVLLDAFAIFLFSFVH